MPAEQIQLSKTRFISGCQCPLRLWFDVHQPELKAPPGPSREALFAAGHRIGELAQERWPGGVLIDVEPWLREKAANVTRQVMADENVPAIYEAGISYKNVLTRVDVLARAPGNAWDLIEVKRSTRVKPPFDTDVALQYWILRGAGIPVRRAGVLLLDRNHVYAGGDHDLNTLFRFEDLTEQCAQRLEEIEQRVADHQEMLAAPAAPKIAMGEQCDRPYPCDYKSHCSRDVKESEFPVRLLPHLQSWRRSGLDARGIEDIRDIPEDFELTAAQERVRQCIATGQPWLGDGLGEALEGITWPIAFLDFEAVSIDVPRFAGMRPFDQLPFQFSCHRQEAAGEDLTHSEFLAQGRTDPRRALAQALLDAVGNEGSIVVYSAYEKRTIGALADWLPDLADRLLPLCDRLVDLLQIIRTHYCHPEFRGSYSIKQVLPVLVPEMSYSGMPIADGEAAGWAWLQMMDAETPQERDQLRTALLAYCGQDSLAMHKLRDALFAQ